MTATQISRQNSPDNLPPVKWLIERPTITGVGDNFDRIRARFVKLTDGCLIFSDRMNEQPLLILAAGQWLSVVPDES